MERELASVKWTLSNHSGIVRVEREDTYRRARRPLGLLVEDEASAIVCIAAVRAVRWVVAGRPVWWHAAAVPLGNGAVRRGAACLAHAHPPTLLAIVIVSVSWSGGCAYVSYRAAIEGEERHRERKFGASLGAVYVHDERRCHDHACHAS